MEVPRLHALVPSFNLPDLAGHRVSLLDYKHEKPLVLVLCRTRCDTLLRDFDERYPHYQDTGAEVLALVPAPPSTQVRFPVLLDMSGSVSDRLARHTPAILVLDTYNALYGRIEGPWTNGPNHESVLSWLTLIMMQCAECGAPEWPYPEG